VTGSVSGLQQNWAYAGTPYISDNGLVSFTILQGATPFADGDFFTFDVDVTGTWGNGTVLNIQPKRANAVVETWTLTCFDATTPGSERFTVESSIGQSYPNATVGSAYDIAPISFSIVPGSQNFMVGDTLTFTVYMGWWVVGTASGVQSFASTGVPYTSDGGEVSFTINQGTVSFTAEGGGDTFFFQTGPKGTVINVELFSTENLDPGMY
jgi:hypothetical protein